MGVGASSRLVHLRIEGIGVSCGLVPTKFVRVLHKQYFAMVFSRKGFHINLLFLCWVTVASYVNNIVQLM